MYVEVIKHVIARQTAQPHFERALQLLVMFNITDAVFTSWWVEAGWAREANPLMAALLELGVGAFIAGKLILGSGGALVLQKWSDRALARFGLLAALIVYGFVVAMHLTEGLAHFARGTLLTVSW